jgi:hypothetical protein
MNRLKVFDFVAIFCLSTCTVQAAEVSPYAGQETREIKALSEAEVAELLAGNGMGYAKVAELNGYPGPAHVLELTDKLGLSAEQRAQTQLNFEQMETSARQLGAELVAAERALDELFRNHDVTQESLSQALAEIGALDARLRESHLRAHLQQTRILSAAQTDRYVQLRGYDAGDEHRGHKHGDP